MHFFILNIYGSIKNSSAKLFGFCSRLCYNNKKEDLFMAKAKGKDYFGLGRVVSIILAIIPITAWICGLITRVKEGKIVAAVVRFFFGFNIVWLIDLVLMIVNGRIMRLLNV